jgi:hypothetical protein
MDFFKCLSGLTGRGPNDDARQDRCWQVSYLAFWCVGEGPMEWAKERRGTRRGDAPPGRRYDMFMVLDVFLPIYPVKRDSLETHVSGLRFLRSANSVTHPYLENRAAR